MAQTPDHDCTFPFCPVCQGFEENGSGRGRPRTTPHPGADDDGDIPGVVLHLSLIHISEPTRPY